MTPAQLADKAFTESVAADLALRLLLSRNTNPGA